MERMKRLLSAELKVWHLLLLVPLIALSAGGAVAIGRAGPSQDQNGLGSQSAEAFFPVGTFAMGASAAHGAKYVKSVDGKVEVLRVAFTVPAGKTADIVTFFNAEGY